MLKDCPTAVVLPLSCDDVCFCAELILSGILLTFTRFENELIRHAFQMSSLTRLGVRMRCERFNGDGDDGGDVEGRCCGNEEVLHSDPAKEMELCGVVSEGLRSKVGSELELDVEEGRSPMK